MKTSLEVRDLVLVQAIAAEGGVTRAARRLHLSQSAVSHQLAGLEQRLGVEIFRREGRGVRITPSGTELLATAQRLLPELASLEARIKAECLKPKKLRLGMECFTGYQWLPQLITELRTIEPGVEIEVVADASRAPLEQLEAERLDLVLCCLSQCDKRWRCEPLFRDELLFVLAPSHPLAKMKTLKQRDLMQQALFVFDVSAKIGAQVTARIFPDGKPYPKTNKVPFTEAISALVRAGLGIGLLPGWSVEADVKAGTLVTRRVNKASHERVWTACFPKSHPNQRLIEKAVGILKQLGPSASPRR